MLELKPCHDDSVYEIHECGPGPEGIHAIIIATSQYPPVGEGDRLFGDLDGTCIGAVNFAQWLATSFQYPAGFPLRTLRILLTPTDDENRTLTEGFPNLVFGQATRAAVESALDQWKKDCNKSPRTLALIYLAGHGTIGTGDTPSIFLSEANDDNPFRASINATTIRDAMLFVKAYANIFIFDCCGVPPEVYQYAAGGGIGFGVPQNAVELREHVLYVASSRVGQVSYVHPDSKNGTLLSHALIPSMAVAGQMVDGEFVVTRTSLDPELKHRVREELRRLGSLKPADYDTRVRGEHDYLGIHRPKDLPRVKVSLRAAPEMQWPVQFTLTALTGEEMAWCETIHSSSEAAELANTVGVGSYQLRTLDALGMAFPRPKHPRVVNIVREGILDIQTGKIQPASEHEAEDEEDE